MNFYLLDKDFKQIDVIDDYQSAIWTDRYLEPGDFELYFTIGSKIPRNIAMGRYLWFGESDHTMIIENIKIETDIEDGNKLIVTGRSLESILDRRIVWEKTVFDKDRFDAIDKTIPDYSSKNPHEEGWFEKSGNNYVESLDETVRSSKTYYENTSDLQTAIKRLINENIIAPSDPDRKISNFIFDEVTSSDKDYDIISKLRIDGEYHGEDLLKILKDVCDTHKIGFKITLRLTGIAGIFVFRLYAGRDKSYNLFNSNYVIFSPNMDNLINSNYSDDMKPHKNVTLCEGPEEDTYDRVDPNGDENPHEEGWYKFVDNEYVLTEDTEVGDYTYYEKDERLKTRVKTVVGSATGLNRREVYTDCSSASREGNLTYDIVVPSQYPDFDEMSPKEEGWYKKIIEHGETYYVKTQDEAPPRRDVSYYIKNTHSRDDVMFKKILAQMGMEKLSENKRAEDFDGEVEYSTGVFKYRRDYKIGDIVQIVNEYGFQGKSRVMEYTYSDNTSDGLKCYPKFEMVEEEG